MKIIVSTVNKQYEIEADSFAVLKTGYLRLDIKSDGIKTVAAFAPGSWHACVEKSVNV